MWVGRRGRGRGRGRVIGCGAEEREGEKVEAGKFRKAPGMEASNQKYRGLSGKWGVWGSNMELSNNSFATVMHNIIVNDRRYLNEQDTSKMQYTLFSKPSVDGLLSHREMECIFYLIRKKSHKEIAKVLFLSHRTVTSYINNIKTKLQCDTQSQIIEKAEALGLFSIIPASIKFI